MLDPGRMKLARLFSALRPSAPLRSSPLRSFLFSSALFSSALFSSALFTTALLAASLTACAVAPPTNDVTNDATNDVTNDPAGSPAHATATGGLETLDCEPYDPAYCDEATSCEVPSQYVQCNSGIYMYAHRTPDCRWCIPRDVCGWNPPVCPF